MNRRPFLSLVLPALLLALLLASCAAGRRGEKGLLEHRETYHVDANLGFAVEHPADWTRTKISAPAGAPYAVRWSSPPPEEVRVTFTSLPPAEAAGGAPRLLGEFRAAHPGFILSARDAVEVGPDEVPALQVVGYTPSRTFLVLLITTSRRAFVLEFSAPPEHFDRFRPLFTEMAESFRVLD